MDAGYDIDPSVPNELRVETAEVGDVRFVGLIQLVMVGGMFMWGEVLIKQGRVGIVFSCVTLGNWLLGLLLGAFIYGI